MRFHIGGQLKPSHIGFSFDFFVYTCTCKENSIVTKILYKMFMMSWFLYELAGNTTCSLSYVTVILSCNTRQNAISMVLFLMSSKSESYRYLVLVKFG